MRRVRAHTHRKPTKPRKPRVPRLTAPIAPLYNYPAVEALAGATAAGPLLNWGTLRDGREVLLADDLWHVPRVGPCVRLGHGVRAAASAFVPGADMIAYGVGGAKIVFQAVPDGASLAALSLPGLDPADAVETLSAAAAAPGASSSLVLAVTHVMCFLIRVVAGGDGAGYTVTVERALDLRAGYLGSVLAPLSVPPPQPFEAGGGRAPHTALWVDANGAPHAVIGRHGRVIVVPLDASRAADAATGPLRIVFAHAPAAHANVPVTTSIALWLSGPGGAPMAVSSGMDMHMALCAIQGPPITDAAVWSRRACATKSRSGKGVRRAVVADAAGVAFSSAQYENRGLFHSLRGAAKAHPLSQTPEFACGDGAIMSAFSFSGMLAFACGQQMRAGGAAAGGVASVFLVRSAAAPPPPPPVDMGATAAAVAAAAGACGGGGGGPAAAAAPPSEALRASPLAAQDDDDNDDVEVDLLVT
jgi:hypothetical protein